MSMFGAPFGIFIAMLVMDKIPRKTMGVGLLVLIAGLGYIYSLQTSMLLITLIGFFLITFVYMYVCYASAVYVPEIWPTEAKLRGSGLANAVGRISGIAAPYAVAVLLNGYGVTGYLFCWEPSPLLSPLPLRPSELKPKASLSKVSVLMQLPANNIDGK